MKRSITICSAQFGDIPLPKLLPKLRSMGYEGVEIACQSHLDIYSVVNDIPLPKLLPKLRSIICPLPQYRHI